MGTDKTLPLFKGRFHAPGSVLVHHTRLIMDQFTAKIFSIKIKKSFQDLDHLPEWMAQN